MTTAAAKTPRTTSFKPQLDLPAGTQVTRLPPIPPVQPKSRGPRATPAKAGDATSAPAPVLAGRCPVTRQAFEAAAQLLIVAPGFRLDAPSVRLSPMRFASGAYGWHGSAKLTLPVGDKPVAVQAGVNVVIIGSKDGKAGVSVDEFLGAATDEFLCIRTPVEGAAGYPATPRGFGTGSFGWSSSARIVVAGMSCQMGLNLIVLGSKPA